MHLQCTKTRNTLEAIRQSLNEAVARKARNLNEAIKIVMQLNFH